MLLWTFVLLSAFGGSMWLLGHYFEYHGVAVIGAVIIIATGGGAAMTDVAIRDGQAIERSYDQFNTTDGNQTAVETSTNISYTQQQVSVTQSIGSLESYMLGALTLIAGALLLVQDLNQADA